MFKGQDGEQIVQTTEIPTDDLLELLECKTRLNILLEFIETNDIQHIKGYGNKISFIDAQEVKLILGYVENENLVKKLIAEYQNQKAEKEPANEQN